MSDLSSQQKIQENQYDYPYHYIPYFDGNDFSQFRYWSWGYRYLGGIKIVLDQLNKLSFKSVLDVGCGDGRFIRELFNKYPEVSCKGVDYSSRAVKMAQMMNPDLNYECIDITDNHTGYKYDVVTSVEVLEHIPPDKLNQFVHSIADLLNDNGYFILTVPHKNKQLNEKHYQHFTGAEVKKILEPFFSDLRIIPFDPSSRFLSYYQKMIGGLGKNYIITNKKITSFLYKLYIKKYLYAPNEKDCGRIAVICQKK